MAHESVEIVAGEATTQDYPLHRNARSVMVMTMPSGAGISIDGEAQGITSGSPPPGYEIMLLEDGLNPADVSAPFTLPFLAAGGHVIRVEKPCYATLEADFQVTLADTELPLELETIVLSPSRSGLQIRSRPPGALVKLDGRPAGTTPLDLDELCGEEVLVQLEMDQVGAWEETVALRPGERRRVDGELRLSLASLGVVREVGVADPSLDVWDEFLRLVVAEQSAYAGLYPEVTVDGISPAHLELFRIIQTAGEGVPALSEDLRQRLHEEIGADLFLVATSSHRSKGTLYLFGLRRARPDILPVASRGAGDRQELAGLLGRASLRTRSWSGLLTVETADNDFPYVVGRSPSAPEGTTLLPGDRIRSVDGRPVVNRSELEGEFAGRDPGSRVPVSIERGEAVVNGIVVASETPVFSRPGGKGVLINKLLADLERLRRVATDDREESLAALGLGIAYLVSGEPARALTEGFDRCRLPSGAGISAGSLDYLKGVSLEALGSGRLAEATAAFKRAAGEKEATLWEDDGPLVAPLAAARTGDSAR